MPEVRLVHNYKVKPGTGADYIGFWDSEYDVMNGQPGCEQWELFQSTTDPDSFALLEHWESRGAFHSYWKIQKVRPIAGKDLIDYSIDAHRNLLGPEVLQAQRRRAPGSPATVDPRTRSRAVAARYASSST